MNEDNEKRHSGLGIAQVGQLSSMTAGGVGGRQGDTPEPAGGGGYLENCTILNFRIDPEKKRDPRLDELREMGLQRIWLEVAEAVGVDAFLKVWRILDADPTNKTDDGRRLVPMRGYACFERYQRNRYIESLVATGKTAEEIAAILAKRIGENISARHIKRFRKQA